MSGITEVRMYLCNDVLFIFIYLVLLKNPMDGSIHLTMSFYNTQCYIWQSSSESCCHSLCHTATILDLPSAIRPADTIRLSHLQYQTCWYHHTSLYCHATGTLRPVSTVRPQLQVLSDVGTVRPAEPVTIGTVRSIATQTSLGHAI